MEDYYKTLGVSKNASQQEIKRAFRKLAHEHHPDKAHGNEAKFKEANQAYQTLSNPQKRAQYDQFGAGFENMGASGAGSGAGFSGFDFNNFRSQGSNANFEDFDLGDIFSDMFGFGGGGRKRARERRGADIQADFTINFEKIFTGSHETLSLRKETVCPRCEGKGSEPGTNITSCQTCKGTGEIRTIHRTILGNLSQVTPCPDCRATGKKIDHPCAKCNGAGRVVGEEKINVDIPAGIREGQIIKLEDKGEAGERGSQSGDLYLTIHIASSKYFHRQGDDVLTEANISFTQAALGSAIFIKTSDGEVKLKIPVGTQPGKVFKLGSKGIPHLNSHGRGDQLVKINLIVPRHLSRKERSLLNELEKEAGETARVD